MIKKVWVATCDCCGHTENIKIILGRYNDSEPSLPDGWGYGYNKDFHICPDCLRYMKGEKE